MPKFHCCTYGTWKAGLIVAGKARSRLRSREAYLRDLVVGAGSKIDKRVIYVGQRKRRIRPCVAREIKELAAAKHSITAANGRLSVFERIPGKPDAGFKSMHIVGIQRIRSSARNLDKRNR